MNEQNLKPFKSGKDWTGNAKGRPKGSKSIKTIIKYTVSIIIKSQANDKCFAKTPKIKWPSTCSFIQVLFNIFFR